VLGCAAFVYGLRWLESSITFHPVRVNAGERPSPPQGAEEIWFSAADGARLHGWFFRNESRPGFATVVYFHGNGGNISNIGWLGQRFTKQGFDVLLFDYRGYGASSGEVVDETDLYADGDAAVTFAIKEKGARPERVVLYGQSLGTAIAADVASRGNFGVVVLESGFSSASSVAKTALPWLPRWLHFLGKNRFESARKLAIVRAPVLIIHGDPDPVIPADEARLLFDSANQPKKMFLIQGVGHNVFGSADEQQIKMISDVILEFLARPPEL
jgi:fermentation-respiration switch protein FrsA (DUF1100 family)